MEKNETTYNSTPILQSYFTPPKAAFWQWGENNNVIEWTNGSTICYRDDLLQLLKGLADDGLPYLNTVLILVAACSKKWTQEEFSFIEKMAANAEEDDSTSVALIDFHLHHTAEFMKLIGTLPAELRSTNKRIHLIREVIRGSNKFSTAIAKTIVSELESGHKVDLFMSGTKTISRTVLKMELDVFDKAFKRFGNKEDLKNVLQTGIAESPAPLAIELPNAAPTDLFEALKEDKKTMGIANLCQRLMAGFHIPMHTRGASDLALGGVSDITNRGEFDRLLLSELANEDSVLMARLANNEAMYLRREDLPSTLDRERIILLDSTIRMWGMARFFAVAAALACTQKNKEQFGITAYALSGSTYTEIDLTSKEGILNALEQLDAALHCGNTFNDFIEDQKTDTQREYILVTHRQTMQHIDFQQTIASSKQQLSFALLVDSEGDLQFAQYTKGNKKILRNTKYDLEELLFPVPFKNTNEKFNNKELPAILYSNPQPLYYPSAGIRLHKKNAAIISFGVIIGVTEIQRLLYWKSSTTGAIELLDYIEDGIYHFESHEEKIFILVYNNLKKLSKYYAFDLVNHTNTQVDFSEHIPHIEEVRFHENQFLIKVKMEHNIDYCLIDCLQNKLIQRPEDHTRIENIFFTKNFSVQDLNFHKKTINNGYSTLQQLSTIGINDDGVLCIGSRQIILHQNTMIKITAKNKNKAVVRNRIPFTLRPSASSTLIKYRQAEWSDGSSAIIDSRGILSFRSSQPDITEFSILLILGKVTACWAADGTVTGSNYFTDTDNPSSIPPKDFYNNYIQPFIDSISALY